MHNNYLHPPVMQDATYKYRAFETPNNKWQVERTKLYDYNGFNGLNNQMFWEYVGTYDSESEADNVVKQWSTRPKYKYY